MSTNIAQDLSFTCPAWCRLSEGARHDKPAVERIGENAYKVTLGHDGPRFGDWSCAAEQNLVTGEWFPDVAIDRSPDADLMTAPEMRAFLENGRKALAWLEAFADSRPTSS